MDFFFEVAIIVILILILLFIARILYIKKKQDLKIAKKTQYLAQLQPNSLPELVPNIILILCDDLGYADLSYYGATAIQTPNIDALADQGLKCTNFYASSAVCSPSRAGILTGRYAIRAHVPVVFFPPPNQSLINIFLCRPILMV